MTTRRVTDRFKGMIALALTAVVLAGAALVVPACLTPAKDTAGSDDDSGAEGPESTSGGNPVTDWPTLVSQLPEPGLATAFQDYHDAVVRAIRQTYSQDTRVTIFSWTTADGLPPYSYGYEFGVYRNPGHQYDDPYAADFLTVAIIFRLYPSPTPHEGALADSIEAGQFVEWDPQALEEVKAWGAEALGRFWRRIIEGYIPVGEGFWESFDAVNRLSFTGFLPCGVFLLPGPGNQEVVLEMNRLDKAEMYYDLGLKLRVSEAAEAEPPRDWSELTAGLPEFNLGSYFAGLTAALSTYWASRDAQVSINGTARYNPSEGWDEERLSWLRLPSSSGSGYLLETLALRFAPVDASQVASETLPLPRSVTVTERIVWEPSYHSGPPPAFQALALARDTVLTSYLPLGDSFWAEFGALEMTAGNEVRLPGAEGTTILLAVEAVSDEEANSYRRYTLTLLADGGG